VALQVSLLGEVSGHSLYPIGAVAAFTRMRRNEIVALRWIDIDHDAGMISVSRSAFCNILEVFDARL
jgi:integrase